MALKKIVIIGGGISGLAAVYRLCELNQKEGTDFEITLLEARDWPGGLIETQFWGGFLLESGPDAFITEKPWALDLCRRLGLENELIETSKTNRQSFILKEGKLTPVPKGFYLMTPTRFGAIWQTSLLSIPAKFRLLLELFLPARKESGDESVAHFVRRRFGKEVLDWLGQPMIGGIYTADPEKLSLQATFPKFLEREKEYGSVIRSFVKQKKQNVAAKEASGPRYGLFLTLRGGMERLIEKLLEKISGAKIRCAAKVESLSFKENCWNIRTRNGQTFLADTVCLALPAFESARLISEMAPELAAQLNSIPYESVVTVNVGFSAKDLPQPLNGFGYVVPQKEKRKIVGCTFSSVKFPGRALGEDALFRVFLGGVFYPEAITWDDEKVEQVVREELKETLGIEAAPQFISIRRYPRAMPQYHVGHLKKVALIEEATQKIAGLYITGNAYRGAGLPDSIREAESNAEKMHAFLKTNSRTFVATS